MGDNISGGIKNTDVEIRNGVLSDATKFAGASIATMKTIIDCLSTDTAHESFLFPEDSNETVTFTAGGTPNTFGAWTEIVDNNAVTFSSKLASNDGHLSTLDIEDASVSGKVYVCEISYGDSKTVVSRHRWVIGTGKQTERKGRFRPLKIPAGETVYYRCKCETGGATSVLHFKYHFH